MSVSRRPSRVLLVGFLSASVAFAGAVAQSPAPVRAASPDVVISQVYGGGGEGTSYRNDYIELFNRGVAPVALDDWSVQYGLQTGSIGTDATLVTPLRGTLPAGAYLLVQEASGGTSGAALPVPALVDPTPIAMSATGGKVALVSTTTGLGCGSTATPCVLDTLPQVVDLVGWDGTNLWEGTSAAPGTTVRTAIFREADGAQDTDMNGQDFFGASPAPRATPDVAPALVSIDPADGAVDVAADATITVTLTEPVAFDSTGLSIACTFASTSIAVSGGPTVFEISHGTFTPGDSCTFTIPADRITDLDPLDPADQLAAPITTRFTVARPVIDRPPTADAGGPYAVTEHGTVVVAATATDPEGGPLSYAWDLDGDGTFETSGASVTYSATSIDAPTSAAATVRVTDAGGLTATAQATIDVIWDFGGFVAPVDPEKVNVAKAGSAVPVKFSLDGPQGLAILAGAPMVRFDSCATDEPEDEVETTANGGGLRYDALTDLYTYVWKTQKAWAGRCGTVVVALADGTNHSFEVRFKS